MKLLGLVIGILGIIWPGASRAEESEVQIAIPDIYIEADEVNAGDDWWGIFPLGDGFGLRTTSVSVAPYAYDDGDSATGMSTGVAISTPEVTKPVVLFRGLKGVNTGAMKDTKWAGNWSFLFPGQKYDVTIENWSLTNQMQIFATGIAERPSGYAVEYSQYELFVSRGNGADERRQSLLSVPEFSSWACPGLLWMGDLDRDGRPEFLLNRSISESGTDLALYLSSAAKEGELVGLVAAWKARKGC